MRKLLQFWILTFFSLHMSANGFKDCSVNRKLKESTCAPTIEIVKDIDKAKKVPLTKLGSYTKALVNQNVCVNGTLTFTGTGFPLGSGTFPAGRYWLVLVDNATNQIVGNAISNQVRLFNRGPLSIQSFAINASIFPGGILPTNFVYRLIQDYTIFSEIAPVEVTITANSENITTITSYQSYTWPNNGQTYTQSGVFNGSTTNCVTEKLDLTITNQPLIKVLDFDGVNDYVTIPNNVTLNPAKFTVDTWVKWGRSGTAIDFICSKGHEVMELHTGGSSSNNIRFIPAPGVYLDGGVDAIVPNTWVHIAAAYDPSQSIARLYVNGINITLTNNGVNSVNTNVPVNSNPLSIGIREGGDYALRGQMDQFRLWNRILTDSEIQTYLSCNILPVDTDLIINLGFNDGVSNGDNTSITALVDSSGNNNNGILNVFAKIGNTSNFVLSSGAHGHVSNNTVNTSTISTCDTYTWANTGQTYTTSGIYTGTTTNCVTEKLDLTINNTTWNGITWSNGAPNASKGAVISGNYSEAIDLTACSLAITGTAIVSVPSGFNFNVAGKVTVAPTASLTFENNANLIQINNVQNEGNITIKRNSNALMLLDYTMWSSPVLGQQLQSFSPETLANRFYTYNPISNKYNGTTPTANFSTGTGYLIRMPNNHPTTPTIWNGSFTGIPNNGNITLTVDNTTYNSIGNPYPSTISANDFITANSLTEPLYFWRKTNNAASSSYATYTLAGGTANAGGMSSIVPNGTIQIGQGFIAKATSTEFVFTNALRTSNNDNQFLKTKAVEKHRIWLNLAQESAPINQMMVAYMKGATAGIDPALDGKFFNDSPIALTSIINNEEFVIQAKGLPFDNSNSVALTFKTNVTGNFTISIDRVDGLFAGNQDIYLNDKTTGTYHNLKNSEYRFTASAGTYNDRFLLVYKNEANLGTNSADEESNAVVVFKNGNDLNIKSEKRLFDSVSIFDIKGQRIFKQIDIRQNYTIIKNLAVSDQTLIVQILLENGKIVSKKIVF